MTYDLFHPVEHNILAQFFHTKSLHPVKIFDIEEDVDKEKDYIGLERDLWGDLDSDFYGLDNAVARLVLEGIQNRLPQWGVVDKDSNVLLAREVSRKKQRKISLAPQRLFSINWATSGPGFSWPEDYYLSYVPLYHRYVVTASQDGPDAYGYTDLAIGHFSGDAEDVISAVGKAIRDWWSDRSNPWEYFDQTRNCVVDEQTAQRWGFQVWGDDAEFVPRWLKLLLERNQVNEDGFD